MPTQNELAGLYDRSKSYVATPGTYRVYLTKFIKLSSHCVSASETSYNQKGVPIAALFIFSSGVKHWYFRSNSKFYRALPVRNAK
jgi:hypothetical protein